MAAPAMLERQQVRLGGYAPADSTHGRALDRIAARLRAGLGDGTTVEIDYNILDRGRPVQELLDDVETGRTTLCFFSTSYLAERVPELGIIDLPYVFRSLGDAHAAGDGVGAARLLGQRLSSPQQSNTGRPQPGGLSRASSTAPAELGSRAVLSLARGGTGVHRPTRGHRDAALGRARCPGEPVRQLRRLRRAQRPPTHHAHGTRLRRARRLRQRRPAPQLVRGGAGC